MKKLHFLMPIIVFFFLLCLTIHYFFQKHYSKIYWELFNTFLKENHLKILAIQEKAGFFSSSIEASLQTESFLEFKSPVILKQAILYGPWLWIKKGFERNLFFGKAYIHTQLFLSGYPQFITACFKDKPFLEVDIIIGFDDCLHMAIHQEACELSEDALLSWSGFSSNIEADLAKEKLFFSFNIPKFYFSNQDIQTYLDKFLIQMVLYKSEAQWVAHLEARMDEIAGQYKDEAMIDLNNTSFVNNTSFEQGNIKALAKIIIRKWSLDEKRMPSLQSLLTLNFASDHSGNVKLELPKVLFDAIFKNTENELPIENVMRDWINKGILTEIDQNYLFHMDFANFEIPWSARTYLTPDAPFKKGGQLAKASWGDL